MYDDFEDIPEMTQEEGAAAAERRYEARIKWAAGNDDESLYIRQTDPDTGEPEYEEED